MKLTKTIRADRGMQVNPFVPELARLLVGAYEYSDDRGKPVELPGGWGWIFRQWENVQIVLARREWKSSDPIPSWWRISTGTPSNPSGLSVAVIPGTNEKADWHRGNLAFGRDTIGGVPGKWREGFKVGGEWVWSKLRDFAQPGDALAVVGHSYGGGMAKNAAAYAARDGRSDSFVALLDFAGPRTTTKAGAEWLSRLYPPPIGQRFDLGFDIVPHAVIPLGWRHALESVCISADGTTYPEHSFWRELRHALSRRGIQAVGDHGMRNYEAWARALPDPEPVG